MATPTSSLPLDWSLGKGIGRLRISRPPKTTFWMKVKEVARLAYTRTEVTFKNLSAPYQPASQAAEFAHYVVEPLNSYKGKNERMILDHCLGNVEVQDGTGSIQRVIHAASHNYAGFYRSTQRSEELQRLCLDSFPLASSGVVAGLEAATNDQLARAVSADFCCTTSTGYGSNLLAFSAILTSAWLVVLDEKCHNSMHVGAYLNQAGLVRKFRHNDLDQLESMLQQHHGKCSNILVAVEGFYSMDGSIPPLDLLAHLKQRFGFTLLADEAHSLQCLGRTGRGCIELWNDEHPKAPISLDLFDVRTATLSKSCGAIGGLVCGSVKFQKAILARRDELLAHGMEPLSPSAMVQTLYVLGQPTQLRRRLRRLKHMAIFVREELQRFGAYIYGDAMTPALPVHTGRPSLAAKLSYVLRQLGVLATPITTPAVPLWESRVRICLSADHDDQTVDKLVSSIISAAQAIGITRKSVLQQRLYHYKNEEPTKQEEIESIRAEQNIREVILQDRGRPCDVKYNTNVLQAGHIARQRYGLATGAARWITGTFPVHVEVEKAIAKLSRTPDAFTYVDSYIGLMSTVAALCRPSIGYNKHYICVPTNAPAAVFDGLRVAPKRCALAVMLYDGLQSLMQIIRAVCGRKVYITLYVHTTLEDNQLDLNAIFERFNKLKGPSGMTILLNDMDGPGYPSGIELEFKLAEISKFRGARLLMYGSFYRKLGLPGAYLAGDAQLVRELRYTSRGYMFTTSQPPYVMGMIAEALRETLNVRDESLSSI